MCGQLLRVLEGHQFAVRRHGHRAENRAAIYFDAALLCVPHLEGESHARLPMSHATPRLLTIRHQPPAAVFGGGSTGFGVSPCVPVARSQCQTRSRNTERRLRPSPGWETPNNDATFLLARSHTFP